MIAAFGLCYACYRAEGRGAPRVDKHSGAINKERQKLFAAYAQLMNVLAKLGASKTDTQVVIEVLRPYWGMIAEQLRESGEERVNSERDVALFTVHSGGTLPERAMQAARTGKRESGPAA